MDHVFLLLLQLALLLITSTHSTNGHAQAAITDQLQQEKQGLESMMRAMHTVGSRPPSCEGRCRSCGRCEAVQVPVTPQAELQKKRPRRSSSGGSSNGGGGGGGGGGSARTRTAAALLPSSYDDHSNYRPLSWRCKCGGMLLNP